MVLDGGLVDDEQRACPLQVTVAKAVLAQKFRAYVLEVFPVAGVVQVTLSVALGVANAELAGTSGSGLGRRVHGQWFR